MVDDVRRAGEDWDFLQNGSILRDGASFLGPASEIRRCAVPFCKVCSNDECAQCDESMAWTGKCSRLDPVTISDFSMYPIIGANQKLVQNSSIDKIETRPFAVAFRLTSTASPRCIYKRQLIYKAKGEVERALILRDMRTSLHETIDSLEKVAIDGFQPGENNTLRYTLHVFGSCNTDFSEGSALEVSLREKEDFSKSIDGALNFGSLGEEGTELALDLPTESRIMLAPWVPLAGESLLEKWQLSMNVQFTQEQNATLFRIEDTAAMVASVKAENITLTFALGGENRVYTKTFFQPWNQMNHLTVRVSPTTIHLALNEESITWGGIGHGLRSMSRVELSPPRDVALLAFPKGNWVIADGMRARVMTVALFQWDKDPYFINTLSFLPAITSGILGAIALLFAFIYLFGFSLKPPM